jgi:hypothetical protein
MGIKKGTKLGPMPKSQKEAISKGQIRRYKRRLNKPYVMPKDKQCVGCKKIKPASDFYLRKQKLKSGISYYLEGRCKKCLVEKNQKHREKLKKEGRYRQMRREEATVRRRKAGIKAKGPWKRYRDKPGGKLLPLKPISELLNKIIKEKGCAGYELAEYIGVDSSVLRRIIKGEENGTPKRFVNEDTVDRILIGLDREHEFHDLYPPE